MDITPLGERLAAGCVGARFAACGYRPIRRDLSERKKELGIRVALGVRPR
jgi:hypothetical protein